MSFHTNISMLKGSTKHEAESIKADIKQFEEKNSWEGLVRNTLCQI